MKRNLKNKKNFYRSGLLFLLMGLFYTSCTDDSPHSGQQTASSEEGYFAIKLNAGDVLAQSKAAGDEIGSAEELQVHSVRIVLYDGEDTNETTCKIEYTFELDITTPGSWNNTGDVSNWVQGKEKELGETIDNIIYPAGNHLYQVGGETNDQFSFITLAQKVKNKPYKMLVLINGKAADPNTVSPVYAATTKGQHFLNKFKTAVTPDLISSTGVLNEGKGIFMSNHQDLINIPEDGLPKTADEAYENPIQVSVDRMAAKVGLKHKDFTFPKGIVEGSERWALDATNKQTYWMRETTDGEVIPSSGMSALYAKDPNYYGALSAGDKENEFNCIRTFDQKGLGFTISKTSVTNDFDTYQYILENTVSATTQEELAKVDDQLTRVIVGYQYIPEGFTATDNYYVFKNTVVSQTKINSLIAGDPEPESLEGIKNAITDAQDAGYDFTGTGTDYFEVLNIKYCPQGQIYYSFPIRHFNKPEGSLGYYGVVRNNIYDISIKSLTPPDVVNDDFFLSGEITIQPWGKREQSTIIGFKVIEEITTYMRVFHLDVDDNKKIYPLYLNSLGLSTTSDHQIVVGKVGDRFYDAQLVLPDVINIINYRYTGQYSAIHTDGPEIILTDRPEENVATLYYKYPGNSSADGNVAASIFIYFVDTSGKILGLTKGADGSGLPVVRHSLPGTINPYYSFYLDDNLLYSKITYTVEIEGGTYSPKMEGGHFMFRKVNGSTVAYTPGNTPTIFATPLDNPTIIDGNGTISARDAVYVIYCNLN